MNKKLLHRRAAPRGLAFESLESRLLLSADLLPAADALASEPSLVPAEHRALEAFDPAPAISMRVAAHELVFVDGAIGDRDRLLADFVRATGADRPLEVVVLDPARDGLAQIGEALAGRTGLTAVHVLSHGRDGALALGATTLDAATLAARADAIAAWGDAFAADGDLLLFGCDVAASAAGESFLGELARLTGADVAASDDATGDAARGGDWALEFSTGAIETAFAALPGAAWRHTLATFTADWDTQAAGTVTESTPNTHVSTFAVGGGTVTVTVADPLDKLGAGPVVSAVLTGGFATDQSLELNSNFYSPGESSTITIDFAGFAGTISNVRFMLFDIDTADDGTGFVDEVVLTANGGALNPTAVTVGPNASVAAGFGAAAIEGANNYAYNTFDGVSRVTGRYSLDDPIVGDPNEEDNAPDTTSNGDVYVVFGQNGIASVAFSYQHPAGSGRTGSGQGIALHDIRFDVNEPPAIAGLGTLNYTENDPASMIAGGATVTDADSADFASGTLTVSFAANGTVADQLAIRNEGVGAGQIGVSGANVTFGGVTIGTFAGGANGTNLVVTLNASATPAAVQALARNITFANASEAPSVLARTVRFTVADGDGGSAFADATVNVAAANDAPVLAGANALAGIAEDPAANGGTTVAALVAGQLSDVDAASLAGIAVTAADNANGAWQYSTDGGTGWTAFGTPSVGAARLLRDTDLVRFVPTADWNGTATIAFRGWDRTTGVAGDPADTAANGGTTAFSTAVRASSITVSAVGDTANDATGTGEDNAVTFNVLANDTFENGGHLLTAVVGAANGTVGFTAAGAVTYTPNLHWNGTETLTYTVTSGGVTETGTLTVTVSAVNDAPTLTIGPNQTVPEDAAPQTVAGFASAAAGGGADELPQTFTYAVTNDNNALFSVQPSIAANGTLTYTLAPNAHGAANVTVTVTDSGGVLNGGIDTSTPGVFAIIATAVADTPSATNAATFEDTQTTAGLVISRNPADGAEVSHFRITGIAGGALFLADGTTAIASGDFITAAQGAAGLRFTPTLNSVAPGSFDVQASTAANVAGLGGGVITASIAITPVNDAPTLAIGANLTLPEDSAPQTVAGFASAAAGGGGDEAGQSFTYTVTNDNNALFAVQPSIAANGTLTYTLAPNAIGAANVSVSVTDSGGTLNGGFDTTGPLAFTITAAPVADTPSVTNAATLEDLQTTAGLVISRNPADGAEVSHYQITGIAGGTLFLADGTTAIASGDFITAAQGAAGLRFTPTLNSIAAGSFGVQASTAANVAGLGGGVINASIAVTAVNDEPSFTIGANQAVLEDAAPQTVAGFASAAAGGGADELPQTSAYTVTNDNNALFAAQPAVAANGTLTYTLAPHASGVATVTIFVTDSGGVLNGGDDAAPAQTFTITAAPVADAPTLTVNAATGNEDAAIALGVASALVDADGSETLTVTVSSIPVGATLSDGVASFTATAGNTATAITGWNLAQLRVTPPLHGDADFTLVIAATATEGANGSVATTTANLAVTVDAVADAPTINLVPAAGNEDTAIALTLGAVLVDADGSEALALALSAIPIGAVLADGGNTFTAGAGNQSVNLAGWNLATLAITPPANADADFTLTVTATATEGANGSAAASVAGLVVDVLPVNDAPTAAAPAAIAVVEDVASPLLGVSFGDVDAYAGAVTATFTVAQGTLSAAAGGGVAVGGTATALTLTGTLADVNAFLAGGGLRYTTVLDGNAPVALTASLNDLGNTGAGGPLASPNANVTLNVIPVNDAPVLGGVALDIDAGGTVVLTAANLSATDVDDAAAGLVFFIANLQNGRFELAGAPGVAVLTFTQGQVTAGQVKFVQTDPLRAPSYLVFVTDGASTVGPGIVALTFRVLGGSGDESKGTRDNAALPAVSFASRTVDTSSGGLADPFAIRFNRQPVVPTDGGGAATPEPEAILPAVGGRQGLATPGTVWELRSRGVAYPDLGFGQMDKLPTAIPALDFGIGPQRPHEEPRGLALALDAVRTVGLVVSVGAVWWASRAAGLVSSLLAMTPTWRHIDPLPVLGRDENEPFGGWEEPDGEEAAQEEASASEMFDGQAKKPAA